MNRMNDDFYLVNSQVQQTFGKTPGSPPEGLMLGSPPGANAQGHNQGCLLICLKLNISIRSCKK